MCVYVCVYIYISQRGVVQVRQCYVFDDEYPVYDAAAQVRNICLCVCVYDEYAVCG